MRAANGIDEVAQRSELIAAIVRRARRQRGMPFKGERSVPTMLDERELALLYLLARDGLAGRGDVVELGAFLGGSSLALATGLIESGGQGSVRLHTFDRFVQEAWPAFGVAAGEDVLRRWQATVEDVSSVIDVHVGSLEDCTAPRGPFDLLFVDIVKQQSTINPVMWEFVAKLPPGAVLVHQDMFHWGSPWVSVSVGALWDRLAYVGDIARSSGVFVVSSPLAEACRSIDWGSISAPASLAIIDDLADRFGHPTLRGSIRLSALYLAKISDAGIYQRRLQVLREELEGPRLRRLLAEVEQSGEAGALAQQG